MKSAIVGLMVLATGCFHVSYDHPTCSSDGECPTGLTCNAQNVCTTGGVINDAASNDASHGDADSDAEVSIPSARRNPIVISGSAVGGTLADFPVWIDLTNADLAESAQVDGSDIFFSGPDGPLDYEIQQWDAPSHHLLAWVRVPSLSSGANTTIYVEYGDPAKAVAQNPKGVFKASFVAVWHLDDSLSTTTVLDSTGTRNGTASGLGPANQVAGKLGNGVSFSGLGMASSIAFTNPLMGSMPHTISVWVNQLVTPHNSTIVVMGNAAPDQGRPLSGSSPPNGARVAGEFYNDDDNSAFDIAGAGWTLLTWTYDGNRVSHLYANGTELDGPFMLSGMPHTTGPKGLIGNTDLNWAPSNGMVGVIDELRIASVSRSATWIATEYANQSSPATFYTVGAQEVAP